MNVYRERAALVAFLAKLYPSVFAYNDPDEPEWAVIYVDTPEGQLTWHVAKEDMDLFPTTINLDPEFAPMWDGHSTATKYARLRRLDPVHDMAAMA